MTENAIRTNSWKAWLLATRPKTLPAAAAPVLIGTGLVVANPAISWQWQPTVICFLFAFLMQIASNLINDLYDFIKGTDRKDRLGPKRTVSEGWITIRAMKSGILITLALACGVGSMALCYAGWELIGVGMLCVLFAFFYTAGPYPLSYHGWGDVLVILFFGFVPVGGTYWLQAHHWTIEVTIASLACGLVVNTLLVLNNYRDREQDLLSGKRTLIVRFGERFGRFFYLFLGFFAVWICLLFIFRGFLVVAVFSTFYLFFHLSAWRKMVAIRSGQRLNEVLSLTGRNIFIFSVLLFLGFILKPAIILLFY